MSFFQLAGLKQGMRVKDFGGLGACKGLGFRCKSLGFSGVRGTGGLGG